MLRGGAGGTPAALGIVTPWGQDPRSGAWFWEVIWKLAEMDADHVTAWSKGGAIDRANCEMLCKSHNRAKGNK